MEPFETEYIPDIDDLAATILTTTSAKSTTSNIITKPNLGSKPNIDAKSNLGSKSNIDAKPNIEPEYQYRPVMNVPEAEYNTVEIDKMLETERQKIVVAAVADSKQKSVEKQTLILSIAVAITGPNVLKDNVVSIGLHAGLSNGVTITQQRWRFPIHETHVSEPTTLDNQDQDRDRDTIFISADNNDDTKSLEQYFNKTMWAMHWKGVPDIIRILQTDTVSKVNGWRHFALTMDSFHVEYPPTKYNVCIVCSMYTDVPFIDAGMYNFVRHASLWETFNPMQRDVSVLDIGSLISSTTDAKKETLLSCIDAITPYDGLPETDAERSFNAYLILNN